MICWLWITSSLLLRRSALTRATNGEALLVQQASNLPNHQHILTLIITPIAAPFDGLELRKFLFPIPQHVRLYRTEIADFTDSEVAFPGMGGSSSLFPGSSIGFYSCL